jgi:hypothetical protein
MSMSFSDEMEVGKAVNEIFGCEDADIEEQLEDARERFESPHVEALQRVARDMTEYLDAAQAQAQRIDSITTQAIAEAGEETQA